MKKRIFFSFVASAMLSLAALLPLPSYQLAQANNFTLQATEVQPTETAELQLAPAPEPEAELEFAPAPEPEDEIEAAVLDLNTDLAIPEDPSADEDEDQGGGGGGGGGGEGDDQGDKKGPINYDPSDAPTISQPKADATLSDYESFEIKGTCAPGAKVYITAKIKNSPVQVVCDGAGNYLAEVSWSGDWSDLQGEGLDTDTPDYKGSIEKISVYQTPANSNTKSPSASVKVYVGFGGMGGGCEYGGVFPDCEDAPGGEDQGGGGVTIDVPANGALMKKGDVFDVSGTCYEVTQGTPSHIFITLNANKNPAYAPCNGTNYQIDNLKWLDSVEMGSKQPLTGYQYDSTDQSTHDAVPISVNILKEMILVLPECMDGKDNEGDGQIDKGDPGCWEDPTDPDTYDNTDDDEGDEPDVPEVNPQCSDDADNDSDTNVDEQDPGCHTDFDPNNPGTYDPQDNDEGDEPQCADNQDNDNDGQTDEQDPGCWEDPGDPGTYDPTDPDEGDEPQCSDDEDNDNDGNTDENDPGCHTDNDPNNPDSYDPKDDNEGDEPDTPQCSDDEDNDNDEQTDEQDPGCHTDNDPDNPDSFDPDDNDEGDEPQCSDNDDNDNDGETDEDDPGCWDDPTDPDTYDPTDPNEGDEPDTPQCSDDQDNDDDNETDEQDPGCWDDPEDEDTYDPNDDEEGDEPACLDNQDNDNDGKTDENDPGCKDDDGNYNPTDDDETDPEDEDDFVPFDPNKDYLNEDNCLEYNELRDLIFDDATSNTSGARSANALKNTYLIVDNITQYLLSGYGGALNETGHANVGLNQYLQRSEGAKLFLLSHCLPALDEDTIPNTRFNGEPMISYKDLPRSGAAPSTTLQNYIYTAQYFTGTEDSIMRGTDEGNFEPFRAFTVEEFMKPLTMVQEFRSGIGSGKDYTGVISLSNRWSYEYYARAAYQGLLQYVPNSVTNPTQPLIRQYAFDALVHAMLQRELYTDEDEETVRDLVD